MSYRNECIAIVAVGMTGLVLGSWLLGTTTPNAVDLLIGALLLALITAQGMLLAILVTWTRRERAPAEDSPRST
jgi:hypothetical protein